VVMKADKKLLNAELDYVKRFLVRQYGEREAKEQLIAFRDILKLKSTIVFYLSY